MLAMTLVTQVVTKSSYNRVREAAIIEEGKQVQSRKGSSYNRGRDRTNRKGGQLETGGQLMTGGRLMIDLIRITFNEWHGGIMAV